MPLNEVGRRFADNLFWQTFHKAIQHRDEQIPLLRNHFASQGALTSGIYISAEAKLLIETIRIGGEARADSLVKAYEVAGIPFDEIVCGEIKSEVVEFCTNQQHAAVGTIGQTVSQFFGQNNYALQKAITDEIVRGVSAIIDQL